MMQDADAAHDFAQRVAEKLAALGKYEGGLAWARRKSASNRQKEMTTLIAAELRAGGWSPGDDGVLAGEIRELTLAEMRGILGREQVP